jgi:hypothetical protein
MLFNPAHTVLNQQANARKASIDTTNLIGHWDPNDTNSYSGSGTTYNNLVSTKEDLKIYGATFPPVPAGNPKHFTFDGTNDKIADIDTSDPYNDNFKIDASDPFAISMWLKFDNFSSESILWTLGASSTDAHGSMSGVADSGVYNAVAINFGSYSFSTKKKLSVNIWYMVTFRARNPESGRTSIDLFLDGVPMEIGSLDGSRWHPMAENYSTGSIVSTQDFDIGYNESDSAYINSATKLGLVLVHQSAVAGNCLPNSQVWANYLATKDTYK